MKSLFEGAKLKGNIYSALAQRLLLMMVLLSICRIGFYLFNISFFPGMSFFNLMYLLWGGIRFDLVTLLYANMLFILLMLLPLDVRFTKWYQSILKYLFFVTNGVALAANVSDFIYYRFTLRRTTADVFRQFENETNMFGLWFKFLIDYWYAVLFWVALMIVLVVLYNKISIQGPQMKRKPVYYIAGTLAIPLIAYLIVGGIRGGFLHSTRPITLSNAGEYVKDSRDIPIVLNTPFAIIRTAGRTKVQKLSYFDDAKLETLYSPLHIPPDTATFKKMNVVVIILESFSKEFMGVFNADKEGGTYKGYTPFLDSLVRHSLTFENSFANGRKSIDGLPSVIAGIPSLGVPYFLSPYSGNKINSLPSLLRAEGYHTSFFHGAPNGSMGFQAFMNIAGVEHYYGMTEYNNDDDSDGIWGIWDDKFLNYYADELNTFQQPFNSIFFSVSSHHPFKIPQAFEGRFKGGPLVMHKCIEYTDFSLKQFFRKAAAMPWYNNTLFVITADHTSSEIQFPETRTAAGFYAVPIIFFKPDNSLAGRSDKIVDQVDIFPTILEYLGYNKPFVAFGNGIQNDPEPFALNYKDDSYQLFEGSYLLQYNGSKTTALYNFKKDKLLEQNLVGQQPEIQAKLEDKIKAIVQQYNNRMIEDRLTPGAASREK